LVMSTLISWWIVGPLYGINICVFILCVHVLQMKGLKKWNLMMFSVAAVQFAIATGHVISIVVQLIRAFGGTSIRTSYILDPSSPEYRAEQFLYLMNCLIGDAILIWRLWIIWQRNFWLSSPFVVLCLATAVTGFTAVVHLTHLSATDAVFLPRVHNWLIATWCLSIATQFGATLMIGYRIWTSIKRNTNNIRESRLAVLWILVESGALYSVTTIFLLGFSATNISPIFVAALGQISALAPTLIIVRAGLRDSPSSSKFTPVNGSTNGPYVPPSRPNNRDMESGTRLGGSAASMVVHIKRATEVRLVNLEREDGDILSTDARSRSPKLPEYPLEYSDL